MLAQLKEKLDAPSKHITNSLSLRLVHLHDQGYSLALMQFI